MLTKHKIIYILSCLLNCLRMPMGATFHHMLSKPNSLLLFIFYRKNKFNTVWLGHIFICV